MKVSDIYRYLNFVKFDKLNLEEGRIYVQQYKNKNLPEILKVELDKFDDQHISFQPHEKIIKIEIYLFLEYTDLINNLSDDIEYNAPYIKQAKIRVKLISNKGNNKYFFFRMDTHFEESEFRLMIEISIILKTMGIYLLLTPQGFFYIQWIYFW